MKHPDELENQEERKTPGLSPWLWAASILVSGVLLAMFYNLYVFSEFHPQNLDLLSGDRNPLLAQRPELLQKVKFVAKGRETNLVWLSYKDVSVPFSIERAAAHRLRIKAYFPQVTYGAGGLMISVNGKEVAEIRPAWKGAHEQFNVDLEGGPFRRGDNTLGIRQKGPNTLKMGYESINIRDFAGYSRNFPRAFVFFDENYTGAGRSIAGRPFAYMLFPSLVFILWLVAGNVMRASKNIPLKDALRRVLWWYAPAFSLFIVAFAYTALTPFTVVCHPETFYALVLAPAFIVILRGLVASVSMGRKKSDKSGAIDEKNLVKAALLSWVRMEKTDRAKGAFTRAARCAATLAVVGFIISLTFAGVMLALKKQHTAETMADVAYFLLVFGVLLRLFDLTKSKS